MISVLVVFGLLGVSGLMARSSLRRLDRASTVVAQLDTSGWQRVTAQIDEATDELGRRLADRIDR